MSFTEAILITFIILLLFAHFSRQKDSVTSGSKTWDCVDRKSGDVTSVTMNYSHGSMCKCKDCSGNTEKKAAAEHLEYFENCQDSADLKNAMAGDCTDDKFSYAVNSFGAPDLSFSDWVAAQAVETDVIKNHAEFVKDRANTKTQNILGRTYSPDSHESYDPIPWVGLRRPQAVTTCNPTQVPDVNYDLYNAKPTFTWSSSL